MTTLKVEFEAAWVAYCSNCRRCIGAGVSMASASDVPDQTSCCGAAADVETT